MRFSCTTISAKRTSGTIPVRRQYSGLFKKQKPYPPMRDKPKSTEIHPQIVEGKPYMLLGILIDRISSEPVQDVRQKTTSPQEIGMSVSKV